MPDDHGPTYTAVRDQLELGVAVSDPRPLDRAVHGALLAIAQGIDELRDELRDRTPEPVPMAGAGELAHVGIGTEPSDIS